MKIVHCKDCVFWKDKHSRQYKKDEWMVTSNIGINIGAMCHVEDDPDKSVFRNENDYCSRAIKRTSSYDEWWGIVDGYYPV